jgi:hypothetical protein
MALIVVAVLFGIVIFGGMLFGLVVAYQEVQHKRVGATPTSAD